MLHIEAAHLLADAAVVIGHHRGLLPALLVPLLAALGALLGILDGDVRQCSPSAAQSQAKLGRLVVDGMLGNTAPRWCS
jgi:hypothetical protein